MNEALVIYAEHPPACIDGDSDDPAWECYACRGAVNLAALLAKARADAAEKAWADGYNDAATMARCYGHTDHWPEEDEPRNPYLAAQPSPALPDTEGGAGRG